MENLYFAIWNHDRAQNPWKHESRPCMYYVITLKDWISLCNGVNVTLLVDT